MCSIIFCVVTLKYHMTELKEEVKTTGRKLSERLLLYLDKAEVKILAELEEKLSKVGLRYELNFASGKRLLRRNHFETR